ncbi:uncharacterized protein DDB_G0286299-like [Ruditapes philippinarum]|uniref:uncharacterized protein DDB_G0286299-like n=1 Tax=Ruditapes philippinarum TaxID=129788 RepID=UPI00295B3175|nr:uncharacterized protein DDB_G0286299-like [Ruditapes philippinarum]
MPMMAEMYFRGCRCRQKCIFEAVANTNISPKTRIRSVPSDRAFKEVQFKFTREQSLPRAAEEKYRDDFSDLSDEELEELEQKPTNTPKKETEELTDDIRTILDEKEENDIESMVVSTKKGVDSTNKKMKNEAETKISLGCDTRQEKAEAKRNEKLSKKKVLAREHQRKKNECKQRQDEAEQRFWEKVRNKARYRRADAERNRSRMSSQRSSISRMSTRACRSLALSSFSSEESLADEGNKKALKVGSSH